MSSSGSNNKLTAARTYREGLVVLLLLEYFLLDNLVRIYERTYDVREVGTRPVVIHIYIDTRAFKTFQKER